MPNNKPSLRAAYEAWLNARYPEPFDTDVEPDPVYAVLRRPLMTVPEAPPVRGPIGYREVESERPLMRAGVRAAGLMISGRPAISPRWPGRVAVIGAGMAGLYSALLLQSRGVDVHLFEAHPNRVGGRVYTHRFNSAKHQYFEAGAMRLPDIPQHQAVFDLIAYLNETVGAESQIVTIPYVLYEGSGNRVFVNGRCQRDGKVMTLDYANRNPNELGFPLTGRNMAKPAATLLNEALEPFLEVLDRNFEEGFRRVHRYDHLSLATYLRRVARWSEDKINYVEVMTSQTNQFQHSFAEMVMESRDFSSATWKTIEDGMERLPNACAEALGDQNISLDAKVFRLEEREDGKIAIHHTGANRPKVFDKLIAAVPPAVLRMLERPRWSVLKEQSIRALHFEPLYKMGLRFRTRFWEKVSRPSRGGQSITDLPSWWIVYPSYGLDENGPGVLLLYSWMTDAACWLPQSNEDRVRIALRDLAQVYQGEVDVQKQFIEAFSVAWPLEWATGDAMFFPGQYGALWNAARQPEGNVYFAGEHLSRNHTWIVGALESALLACQQLLGDPYVDVLRPRGCSREPHTYDYNACAAA